MTQPVWVVILLFLQKRFQETLLGPAKEFYFTNLFFKHT